MCPFCLPASAHSCPPFSSNQAIHASIDQCACLPACLCVVAMPTPVKIHPSIHRSVDSFLQLAGHTYVHRPVCVLWLYWEDTCLFVVCLVVYLLQSLPLCPHGRLSVRRAGGLAITRKATRSSRRRQAEMGNTHTLCDTHLATPRDTRATQ